MQPTYLPWAGYFNLIDHSDTFIFLDDVKLEKSSWHVRNRILLNGEVKFITLPVKGSRLGNINETIVDDSKQWRRSHLSLLSQAYGKCKFGKEIISLLKPIIEDETLTILSELNQAIVKAISSKLDIKTEFITSSNLPVKGIRSERLLGLCHYLGETNYLSPIGSKEYIEEDGILSANHIKVFYQNYHPREYIQKFSEQFSSHLSIVDVLSNIGWEETKSYIRGEI